MANMHREKTLIISAHVELKFNIFSCQGESSNNVRFMKEKVFPGIHFVLSTASHSSKGESIFFCTHDKVTTVFLYYKLMKFSVFIAIQHFINYNIRKIAIFSYSNRLVKIIINCIYGGI